MTKLICLQIWPELILNLLIPLVWIFIYFAAEILYFNFFCRVVVQWMLAQALLGVYVLWYMCWITFLKSENFLIWKHLALRVPDKGLWISHLLSHLEGIVFKKCEMLLYSRQFFTLCIKWFLSYFLNLYLLKSDYNRIVEYGLGKREGSMKWNWSTE